MHTLYYQTVLRNEIQTKTEIIPGGGLPHGSIRGRAALEDYVFHCFSIFEVFLGVSFS